MNSGDEEQQHVVDGYFDRVAAYWQDVYRQDGLQGLVYRRRMELVLQWVDALALPTGAAVLDVGCGAGLLSLELARRGLAVTATDSSPQMVELVRRLAADHDALTLTARRADVHALPFPPADFQLIVALGLLPWLHDAERAVGEMARVLAPGGCMVLTADNRSRLNFVLEPRENPLLEPVRRAGKNLPLVGGAIRARAARGSEGASSYRHLPAQIDRMLEAADLRPIRRSTVGFGPFTFLGRRVLPDRLGTALNRHLERASMQRDTLRRLGWHYVVAARKQP